jgi:hypothetical protein
MSLPKQSGQASLFGVRVLWAELFEPGNRYEVLAQRVLPALWAKREDLARLYCPDNGRPAIEPVWLAAVTLLQFMDKLPDRQAVEALRYHLGWKRALDVEVGYEAFHPTRRVKFRQRLLEGSAERVVFDGLVQALEGAGLVKKRGKQRLDSTQVVGCVAKMGRLEVVRETLRLALEWLQREGMAGEVPEWKIWWERYVDSDVPWHRLSVESLKEKSAEAGRDALALIQWLQQQPALLRDSEPARLLERVFEEQYELSAGQATWRVKEGSGGVKNPHDPDAQWATKDLAKTTSWVGYKVQIAETVPERAEPKAKGEPTEQFITEVVTTEAITSDVEGLRQVLSAQAKHRRDQPAELYVDAAYVTDDTLAEAQAEGRELIGPARPCGNAPGNGFSAEQFDVNTAPRRAVCPAGHPSRQCSLIHDRYNGSVYLRFEWAGLCDECPLQKQCTQSRTGRRLLVVGVHHDLLQQRRREMKTEAFRARWRQRAAIEGTISEFARGGGRRTRYRGLRKTALANYMHGAAINAKRWIRLVQWQQEGKTIEQVA